LPGREVPQTTRGSHIERVVAGGFPIALSRTTAARARWFDDMTGLARVRARHRLLLVGVVAERDGLFAGAGARLARLPVGPPGLLLASLALVAVVTAVLNLDTSVFFLTPVPLHLARTRGVDETPFLYGAVLMSNSASLFLPGSNLNNLPAAALFTPVPPVHARALLLGLNLGPNLAVTGSLSALLWFRVARSLGARSSARTYSFVGVVLGPLSLAAALGAIWLVPGGV